MRLDPALKTAEALLNTLKPTCERIELAGSASRFKPEVHDIEFVLVPDMAPVPRAKLEFGKPVPRRYDTQLDKLLDEMQKDGAIAIVKDGPRLKTIYLKYAGISVELYINLPPSEWGVQKLIRTGPSDFSHWCVCERPRGPLPEGHFVRHQVVWVASEIKRHEVPEHDPNKAIPLLTETNHLSMPEEIDFLKFLGLGWIEPKDRVAKWDR